MKPGSEEQILIRTAGLASTQSGHSLKTTGDMARPALAVTRLTVTDFRGYERARLDADGRSMVLTGPNGAGKTNLLEALSFLVPGRGLRRARLGEVTRIGAAPKTTGTAWAVAAHAITPSGGVDLGTGCELSAPEHPGDAPRERRAVRVDGETKRGQAALSEHLGMVWLTPQMDRLFLEGAAGRRRFVDRLVHGFDPAHTGRISAWDHAQRARAKLLRDGRGDEAWLAALEDTMAQKGVAIAAARLDLAQRLDAIEAARVAHRDAFPTASVSMTGELENWLAAGPALEAEDRMRANLAAQRRYDAQVGGASCGPHKSDLTVRHVAKNMLAEQCSTGEQKALLVALVLADAHLRAAERGAPPVLLLDEVTAHLDAEKRDALFGEIQDMGAQAWLTGTDPAAFRSLRSNACFVRVADAVLTPE